ncbi:hypothetical protein FYJ91_16625 [Sphingomonas montanisoli]|uniref:Uncharacterized protein n=1 Tax=Sphingomonas montanisoli TaxID=2606412 RepID=A0A5D9BZN6_9SPHN|nr:hypothetical protein FYJ91_16625 [Sphingomonas montanisoli]
MDRLISISRYANDRRIVGDVVRFDAKHFGQPIFIDICLIQWTVLRDQHPDAADAFTTLEKLSRDGRWRTDDNGVRALFVTLPPMVIEHPRNG